MNILKKILIELQIPTIIVTHDYNDIIFFWWNMILLKNKTIQYNWNIKNLDENYKKEFNILLYL